MQVIKKTTGNTTKTEDLRYDPTTGRFTWDKVNEHNQPGTGGEQPDSPYTPVQPSVQSSVQQTTQAQPSANKSPAVAAAPDYSAYAYDPSTNAAYTNAMAALEKAKGELPQYAGTYDGQLDALYQQIVGRDKFNYDLNEDMFYQQAADQYAKMGNMAMMDTMGQAAALTGGYGNTYAQNLGQQAYQGYLQQLNDNIPQFYQMALDAHNAEGDRLMQQYGLLGDLANREYGMYQDELSNYWQNVNHLQGIADAEYGRGYENWYNAQHLGTSQQNQNYDRLVTMMSTMGYKPSAEEIAAAGMNPNQAQAFMDYYAAQNQPSYTAPATDPAPTYSEIYEEAMEAMRNGEGLSAVAELTISAKNAGLISAEEKTRITNDALALYNTLR
jgi:hypothetical protein